MKDYHYILGVEKEASKEDIKSAFRKLSKKFHPDLNQGDKFYEQRFKDIREAYEALISESKESKSYAKRKQESAPQIIDFSISKTNVNVGEKVSFSWKVLNAEAVDIDLFGKVLSEGEKIIVFKKPFDTKKIRLNALKRDSRIFKEVTLTVKEKLEKKNGKSIEVKIFLFLLFLSALVVLFQFS